MERVQIEAAATAPERGSASTVSTGTGTGTGTVGIRINIANTIARVKSNINISVKKEQPISFVNRIKNTIQKVCTVVKDTAADIIAKLKLTIAAIVA